MKISALLLLFFAFHISHSQEQIEYSFKYDSIATIDWENCIVYHKKKCGVYNSSKKAFTIPMQKDYLHGFPLSHTVLSITKEGGIKEYDFFTTTFSSEKSYWNNDFQDVLEVNHRNSLKVIKPDIILVNEHVFEYESVIPIINMYGEDSIDHYGNHVYYPRTPGREGSGIYQISTKKWLVEPSYFQIYQIGEYYIGYRQFDQYGDPFENRSDHYIDLFENKDGDFQKIERITYSPNSSDYSKLLQRGLKLDSVKLQDGSTSIYVGFKNKKQGIYQFQLFGEWINFDFRTIVEPVNSFAYYAENENVLITKQDDIFNCHYFDYNTNNLELKGSFANTMTLEIDPYSYNTMFHFDKYASRELSESTLISIISTENKVVINSTSPQINQELPLFTIYGEDSLNFEGDLVYPPPFPGSYHSGVYDLEQNKWTIQPKHYFIMNHNAERFYVIDLNLDEEGIVIDDTELYTVYDGSGNFLHDNTSLQKMTRDELVRELLQGDDIFYTGAGTQPFELINTTNYPSHMLYTVVKDKKQKCVRIDFNERNIIAGIHTINHKPLDFVYGKEVESIEGSSLPLHYYFSLEKDKPAIHFYFENDTIQTFIFDSIFSETESFDLKIIHPRAITYHNEEQVIVFIQAKVQNEESMLLLTYNAPLKFYKLTLEELSNHLETLPNTDSVHLMKKDDLILVSQTSNEHQQEQLMDEFETFYSDIYLYSFFENENTAAWKKIDGTWKKITDDFTKISPTSFGFIGEKTSIKQNYDYYLLEEVNYETYDSLTNSLFQKEKSYHLLNDQYGVLNNFNGVNQFSKIVEYEFGYQIFTNYFESILINNEGKVLCTDHFDTYYEEDGTLFGENKEVYEFDEEYFDYVYDADGNPVILRHAEKRKIER